jgi:hypothetical protein
VTPAAAALEPAGAAAAPAAAELSATAGKDASALETTRGAVPAPVAAPSPAPSVLSAPEEAPRRLPGWGVSLGAGFPDFASASLMYRPWDFLRLSAGPAWNSVGWAIQGGVAIAPWNWALTPVLAVEGGRFFRSNYSRLLKDDDEDAADVKPLLERVDFSYVATDLGVDIGSPRGFAVSLRFGLSFVWLGLNGSATSRDDDGTSVTLRDPKLEATLPSAKLRLQYWF